MTEDMIARHDRATTQAIDSTVQAISARAVRVPVVAPMQTAAGEAHTMPLVLIDLTTSAGTTGRAYLIAYTPLVLTPLTLLVSELGQAIIGTPAAPVDVDADLRSRLRLLRPQGLATMAISGIGYRPLGRAGESRASAVGAPARRRQARRSRVRQSEVDAPVGRR
ncbi:enolase-like domain-containing protein [Streptomyces nodosus]|uniref:hypothetical protein n=1 Tax=Streptomyces nodosus TaxID=40318 RepID=UPI00380F3703